MFFDDPKNALSVARTHQRDLLKKEQMDHLARKVEPRQRHAPDVVVAVFHALALLGSRARRLLKGRARRPAFSTGSTSEVVRQP